MTCTNCNAPLEEQARFCVKCGAPVAASEPGQPLAPPERGGTEIALQPKRVDNPIRPPKRPVPAQLANQEQNGVGNKRETGNKGPLLTAMTSVEGKHRKQAGEANSTAIDAVHEAPTVPFVPENHADHTTTSEKKSALYDQPTLITRRDNVYPEDRAPVAPPDVPTSPFQVQNVPHPELTETDKAAEPGKAEAQRPVLSSPERAQAFVYYRLNTATKGSQKLPAVVNRTAYNRGRRRGCAGCILSGLGTLIVLLIVVGALWIFALRPYAHDIAQRELDNALSSAVNQLPPQAAQLPAGSTIPINENIINNLIVLNLTPSNPVQHPTTTISTQNIRLDFQLYNLPCAVTMVPKVNNGRLIVGNVGIEGVFAAIMSPEEMTNLLNKHLSDAQSKLQRTVTSVQLKDHEADLTLG